MVITHLPAANKSIYLYVFYLSVCNTNKGIRRFEFERKLELLIEHSQNLKQQIQYILSLASFFRWLSCNFTRKLEEREEEKFYEAPC